MNLLSESDQLFYWDKNPKLVDIIRRCEDVLLAIRREAQEEKGEFPKWVKRMIDNFLNKPRD